MPSGDTGSANAWAVGVDVGATKTEVAKVDAHGNISHRLRRPTPVKEGSEAVALEIVSMVAEILAQNTVPPVGIGIGIAGQIQPGTGIVRSSPNLFWHDVTLQFELNKHLAFPIVIANDVWVATYGEWLRGAGQGFSDIVCVFVGTGIGGGVVSGGRLLEGASGTAGEIGHMTIDLHGAVCHCGNQGCLETLAGGWAIAARARARIEANPDSGATLLTTAKGDLSAITAKMVAEAAAADDAISVTLIAEAKQALIAGAISLVNAFNPSCLILGGGIIEGLPGLVKEIELGINARALKVATERLSVRCAELHGDAVVVGAGVMALQLLNKAEGDSKWVNPELSGHGTG